MRKTFFSVSFADEALGLVHFTPSRELRMNWSGLCMLRVAGAELETLSQVSVELGESCSPVCSLIPPTQVSKGTGVRSVSSSPTSALTVGRLGGSHLNSPNVQFLEGKR